MTRDYVGANDENLVVTDRGGVIENTHEIHAAVVDASGRLLYSVGDPHRVTLIRSAAKPVQALAVAETGALDSSSFGDEELALMCASHSAEDGHVERARKMLRSVGAQESDLRCGGHPSIMPRITERWVREGVEPTAVHNNCSGKHAGMLAGARALGAPLEGYHLAGHPMQERVRRVVEEVAGLPRDEVRWGVDGCNMPAPAYPLTHLAKTYALFAKAADDEDDEDDGEAEEERVKGRKAWMACIFRAMSGHPEQVAGQGRFCTTLMRAFSGNLIGKVGADACYAIGVRGSGGCEWTRRLGAEGPVGIAVKVADGNLDILYAAVPELLERLGVGTPEMRAALDRFHHLEMRNSMGVVTGKVAFPFRVRAPAEDVPSSPVVKA
ncbi:hypothetical protein N3K66_001705 [Trichothecium roseum]|uniref:Uncharacterized protein n=1 Tax=Trichothecium roseum TaxID=47278 RepID=A0ACC0V894_9HYPO|nr:hypothetical protein N3K66_001705 [Trichothecium roseum]